MSKYLFIYRTPKSETPQPEPSPEEMQQMLSQWTAWKEKFAKQVVDMGDGLLPGGKILSDGKVTDGPFVEIKEVLGGYSVVEAADYDEALSVAKECPMVYAPGYSIEIRELAGF